MNSSVEKRGNILITHFRSIITRGKPYILMPLRLSLERFAIVWLHQKEIHTTVTISNVILKQGQKSLVQSPKTLFSRKKLLSKTYFFKVPLQKALELVKLVSLYFKPHCIEQK